jgi:hypothetical protein
MEHNDETSLPFEGMNPDDPNFPPQEEKQLPPNLDRGHTVDGVSGTDVLLDGAGSIANGAGILGNGAELAGGVANAAGELVSGAGELISGGAEAAGSVIEGVGGCLDGCGSCSLAVLVAIFAMAGTAVAVFR